MKIMIVEDDAITRRILESSLKKWGYEVISVIDGSAAWEIMRNPNAPSLVISDWMMPNMDGVELCKKIRAIEKAEYTYFILLTTKTEKKDIIEGLESGADDFIVKPFDHEELKSRVKIGKRIIRLEQRIIQLANTDFLTGIMNRRAFMARLEEEVSRSVRHKKGLTVIIADIDHFKKINDSYGHQSGDLVLQKFAGKLSESSRSYDFVGRYGGEEFIVCLPETSIEQAGLIAERMRGEIAGLKINLPDNSSAPVSVTASFGIASCAMNCFGNIDSIIKLADDALYRAKDEGRNRVCLAEN
jgi:two-component system, cell cycle response regulator